MTERRTADEIAADLRRQVRTGELRPGDALPRIGQLTARFGVAQQTARNAVEMLKREGLVEYLGGRAGNVVRHQASRRTRILRARAVRRDDIGYYFDDVAQSWELLRPTVIEARPASADVADLLSVGVGTDVLVRDRLVGATSDPDLRQATASYFPLWLAEELPVLSSYDSGPGGIYDRIEEAGHGPLSWHEEVTARAATPEEVSELALPPGVPVLVVTRVTAARRGRVVEVNEVRMSTDRWGVRYPLRRTPGATWPATPATRQNLGSHASPDPEQTAP